MEQDVQRHERLVLPTESELKSMSRNIKDLIPRSDTADEITNVQVVFNRVLSSSSDLSLNTTHRVAAWNTLCTVIEQVSNSSAVATNDGLWKDRIWNQTFELYLEQSYLSRPKSAKQLLASLSSTLKSRNDPPELTVSIITRVLQGLRRKDSSGEAKACLQVLRQFLKTGALRLDDILRQLPTRESRRSPTTGNEAIEDLLSTVFEWIGNADLASVVSQTVSAILDRAEEEGLYFESNQQPLWARPLNIALQTNHVETHDLRTHILPVLFKRNVSDYYNFLHIRGLGRLFGSYPVSGFEGQKDDNDESNILYAALQTGKELGILQETVAADIFQSTSTVLIPIILYHHLLARSSPEARITGLSLLITSHSATQPLLRQAISLLRRYLPNIFADTDANFRSEVFSLMQRLMDRLRAITAVLARSSGMSGHALDSTPSRTVATLQDHRQFLEWLLGFIPQELRPTATYQRHISGLKTLLVIVKSGLDKNVPAKALSKSAKAETKWPFHISIMTTGLRRTLLDLLMNPFDDVRHTSASVLSLYAEMDNAASIANSRKVLLKGIDCAEKVMLATGRADQADGVAHLYALLYRQCNTLLAEHDSDESLSKSVLFHLLQSLEEKLLVAKGNLATAVEQYPVHGLLTSLRYIILQHNDEDDLKNMLERLLRSQQTLWEIVKPILCNDAPEGLTIDDIEDMSDISTKDTLSYCWRALKESSLLIGVIVGQDNIQTSDTMILVELCYKQLAQLRHRGAFSTVSQTWITCCQRCVATGSPGSQSSLRTWYERTLNVLRNNATINTRRSAGFPSLLCGLLIADKPGVMIEQAFKDLTTIARQPVDPSLAQEGSLSQVHALNCMKDILKNTRLSQYSEKYVAQSLGLAADSLQSEAWAVRNCGLMLFRSVIDRLLGTSDTYLDDESANSKSISLQQHPDLLDIMLGLLNAPGTDSFDHFDSGHESVFPALQLLQRIDIPDQRKVEVRDALRILTTSSSWHVRDKAARVFATIIKPDEVDKEIESCLNLNARDQNRLHGALLCVKYIIARLPRLPNPGTWIDAEDRQKQDLTLTEQMCFWLSIVLSKSSLFHHNPCTITKAAYIDIVGELWKHGCKPSSSSQEQQHSKEYALLQTNKVLDIRLELKKTLNTESCNSATATLRSALSCALGSAIGSGDEFISPEASETDTSLILILSQRDADACCLLFRSLAESAKNNSKMSSRRLKATLTASCDILNGSCYLRLKCEVQAFLLVLADSMDLPMTSSGEHDYFIAACGCGILPALLVSNQQYADQWLPLQAFALEQSYLSGRKRLEVLMIDLVKLTESCNLAVRGGSLYSAAAAAHAINRLSTVWTHVSDSEPRTFCKFCFATYDLLNDDDEDIRLLASRTTLKLIEAKRGSRQYPTLDPPEARQKLLGFMISRFSGQLHFITEAFTRAFGISQSHTQSVAEQLLAFTTIDTALFVEEKQNLYIDDALEVKVWSQVLVRSVKASTPRSLVKLLSTWISNGVDALTEWFRAESDGALGWSTKPEVFTLGLQVICGAELLLFLVNRGGRLPIRPSGLRLQLLRLLVIARKRDANELWVREMERVLKRAVVDRLKHFAGCLGAVSDLG